MTTTFLHWDAIILLVVCGVNVGVLWCGIHDISPVLIVLSVLMIVFFLSVGVTSL